MGVISEQRLGRVKIPLCVLKKAHTDESTEKALELFFGDSIVREANMHSGNGFNTEYIEYIMYNKNFEPIAIGFITPLYNITFTTSSRFDGTSMPISYKVHQISDNASII